MPYLLLLMFSFGPAAAGIVVTGLFAVSCADQVIAKASTKKMCS